jgi:hypothetical protein
MDPPVVKAWQLIEAVRRHSTASLPGSRCEFWITMVLLSQAAGVALLLDFLFCEITKKKLFLQTKVTVGTQDRNYLMARSEKT